MGARWYHPALGRFVSADSIVPEAGNPQALNRYAFVYNNPVKYTDPTGHEACYDTGVEIGSGISQADCWAYGRDKWMIGLPVAAPVAGEGYGHLTARFMQIIGGGGRRDETLYDIVENQGNGNLAIQYVLSKFPGINLPSGVAWAYSSKLKGEGWNPVGGEIDPINDGFVAHGGSVDLSVYISKEAFVTFNYDPNGMIGVILHEARHAWVEYYVENYSNIPLSNSTADWEEADAGYTALLAVDYGYVLSPEAIHVQSGYVQTYCSRFWATNQCEQPSKSLQGYYGIAFPFTDMFTTHPYPCRKAGC